MHIVLFRYLALFWGLTTIARGLYVPQGRTDFSTLRVGNDTAYTASPPLELVARAKKQRLSEKVAKGSRRSGLKASTPNSSGKQSKGRKGKGGKINNRGGPKSRGKKGTGSVTSKTRKSPPKSATRSGSKKPTATCPVVGPGSRSKSPRKAPGKSKSRKGDVCDYVPARHPTTAIDTCKYLLDCPSGDEADPDEQDRKRKGSKSIKHSKSTKQHKSSKHLTTKLPNRRSLEIYEHELRHSFFVDLQDPDELVARGDPRRYKTEVDGLEKLHIYSLDYPSNSDLYTGDGKDLQKVTITWQSSELDNTHVVDLKKVPKDYTNFVTEHLIELQTVKMFIEYLVKNSIVEGSWFEEWWTKELDDKKVEERTSKALVFESKAELGPQPTINDLVFQALGSNDNRGDFVLCNKEINTYKMRTWSKHNYMDPKKFDELLIDFQKGAVDSREVISIFRVIFGVYNYMNHKEVRDRLKNTFDNVKRELSNVEELTGEDQNLHIHWTVFMTEHLDSIDKHGKEWMTARFADTKAAYKDAITAMEKHKKEHLEKKVKPLTRSTTETIVKDIQIAEGEIEKLEKEMQSAKEDRKSLKSAYWAALRRKDQTEIDEAKGDLNKSKNKLKGLKQRMIEHQKEKNIQERKLELVRFDRVKGILKDYEDDLKRLLEYERKTKDLQMPSLGSQMAINTKPGST